MHSMIDTVSRVRFHPARLGVTSGFVLCLAACSDGTTGGMDAGGCRAQFSGNFDAVVSGNGACGTIVADDDAGAGTRTLNFSLTNAHTATPVKITIDLGTSPAAGTYASATVDSWSVTAATDQNCFYTAGTGVVPTGSFALDLGSVSATSAHGMLTVQFGVHAPPGVDCGFGDRESVVVEF